MHSTHQIKLSNVNLHVHHYSEYADLKYTCNHWKYEHFFKTKENLRLQINSVAIEMQQLQYFISSQLSLNPMALQEAALIKAGQGNQ